MPLARARVSGPEERPKSTARAVAAAITAGRMNAANF
jgi:hypothetical protein